MRRRTNILASSPRPGPSRTAGRVGVLGTVDRMRQLVPTSADAAEVDPVTAYLSAERPSPAGRPWFVVGMVASIDGATAIDGRSGGLGGEADKAVFRAVRAVADVIMVGAGTLRAERYGPVRFSETVVEARRRAGRDTAPPRLAIVTSSLDLDLAADIFTVDGSRPIILTTTDADDRRVDAVAELADVHRVGAGRVDLTAAAAILADMGVGVVVSEGGPALNGALADADLIDEICLSIAPQMAGGDSVRVVAGAAPADLDFGLASLLIEDDVLFARWTRS